MTRAWMIAGILFLSAPALAQEAPADGAEAKPREKTNPDGSKTIDLGKFQVQGQVRKPEAFYILQRSSLSYQEVEQKKSFLGEVVRSVDKGKKF